MIKPRMAATAQDIKDLLAGGATVQQVADTTGFPRSTVLATITNWPGWLHDQGTDTAIRPEDGSGKRRGPKPKPVPVADEIPEVIAPSPGHGEHEPDPRPAFALPGAETPHVPFQYPNGTQPPVPPLNLTAKTAPAPIAPQSETAVRKPDKLMDAIAVALGLLDNHNDPAVAKDVQRARDALAKLRSTLAASEERRAAECALADAEAAVVQAKERLRALKAGKSTAPIAAATPTAVSSAATADPDRNRTIRAWAAENGIEVPARGRIPRTVQEQYEARNDTAGAR